MKLSTKNNLHDHTAMLTCAAVNHITEQDWTLDELDAFANFVRDMAALSDEDRIAGEMYDDYLWHRRQYSETMEAATMEELEDPESTYLDDKFFLVKLAVEDMAAELVLYSGSRYYFSDAYSG